MARCVTKDVTTKLRCDRKSTKSQSCLSQGINQAPGTVLHSPSFSTCVYAQRERVTVHQKICGPDNSIIITGIVACLVLPPLLYAQSKSYISILVWYNASRWRDLALFPFLFDIQLYAVGAPQLEPDGTAQALRSQNCRFLPRSPLSNSSDAGVFFANRQTTHAANK